MRFFRRRSSPALLALLAIAMQAALLVAHAHVHRPAPVAAQGVGNGATIACRALVRPAGCSPVIPHDRHDDCPLCWSLVASGSVVLPAPLALAAVTVPAQALRPPTATPALGEAGSSPFQARAPPAA